MPAKSPLPAAFYARSVLEVAPGLLGCLLFRQIDGDLLSGWIVETEAYNGESDLACHARAGRTPRTQVMYGPPGRAYVYFTYGMHWLLNCVTEPEGKPSAALIRAVLPISGLEVISRRRAGRDPAQWANGPAKLCKAFGIDGTLNGADITSSDTGLWIEPGQHISLDEIITGARVGIAYAGEPWVSMPWRYRLSADTIKHLSRKEII